MQCDAAAAQHLGLIAGLHTDKATAREKLAQMVARDLSTAQLLLVQESEASHGPTMLHKQPSSGRAKTQQHHRAAAQGSNHRQSLAAMSNPGGKQAPTHSSATCSAGLLPPGSLMAWPPDQQADGLPPD